MRYPREVAKSAVIRALTLGPVQASRLRRIKKSQCLTVLNLHRVSDDMSSSYVPLKPAMFRELLQFVARKFHPLTLQEFEQSSAQFDKPPIVLSFDDGYRDFIDVAVPIAAEFGIKLNQNIIPECVESGLPPLNVMAQDFVGQVPLSALRELDVPGFTTDARVEDKLRYGARLSGFLKNRSHAEQKSLAQYLIPQFQRRAEFRPTQMMTLSDIREVAAEHEIGAHSFSHATMTFEADDYFRADVAQCQDYFSRNLNAAVSIYAFPNGAFKASQITTLREMGLRHILLVDEAFSEPGSDLYRRFTFHANSKLEVYFRALGGLSRVRGSGA